MASVDSVLASAFTPHTDTLTRALRCSDAEKVRLVGKCIELFLFYLLRPK